MLPVGVRARYELQDAPVQYAARVILAIGQRERQRPPGRLDHGTQELELILERVEFEDSLQHSGAASAHLCRDAYAFVVRGAEGRRMLTTARPVHGKPVGAEAERARLDCFAS